MMEETAVREVLVTNTLQVLETAAMAFVETADGLGVLDEELPVLAACMDFDGRASGHIALAAGENLSRRLAADMVGLDEAEAEMWEGEGADPADALAELLNIIGMISLEGVFPGFSLKVDPPRPLSLPGYLEMGGTESGGPRREAALVVNQGFVTEEGVFELLLVVERWAGV